MANGGPKSALDGHLGARPISDVLSGTAHVRLGGEVYDLPELAHRPNASFLESIEDFMVALLNALDEPDADIRAILRELKGAPRQMLDLIYSYDSGVVKGKPTRTGVLPPREDIENTATDSEIVLAGMGVWQAANPFLETGLLGDILQNLSIKPAPTHSSPPPTATRTKRSKRH